MKKLFVLFFVLFACTAYTQGVPSPSTPRLMADDAGNYVSQSYPLPVSIGGADSANIASMALDIAIISDSINNPIEWKISVASVTSTVATFTSQLTSDTRRFVAIKNRDAFKPVCLGFEDTVTVETGLPIKDSLYIETPKDVPLYFISAEEVGIVLMEGGR